MDKYLANQFHKPYVIKVFIRFVINNKLFYYVRKILFNNPEYA